MELELLVVTFDVRPGFWNAVPLIRLLGPRAMTALAEIQSRLGLEYAGIGFGLSAALSV